MNVLDAFVEKYMLSETHTKIVPAIAVEQLRQSKVSVEELCNHITSKYKYLLHGSQTYIRNMSLAPNQQGDVFATDTGAIALLKAIISNKGLSEKGLEYPYHPQTQEDARVIIHGMHEKTISDVGFVYIISSRRSFENIPQDSWQYVSSENRQIPFFKIIPVKKEDFTYPIIRGELQNGVH